MRTVLMALRSLGGDADAEPVEVDTDTFGETVLTLDDGTRLVFDAGELQASVRHPQAAQRVQAA